MQRIHGFHSACRFLYSKGRRGRLPPVSLGAVLVGCVASCDVGVWEFVELQVAAPPANTIWQCWEEFNRTPKARCHRFER